jgi:RNA polymerase sigma-70 factor (family 1)
LNKYETYSDEQLLELLKNSDEGAFREIYDRYWKKLLIKAARKIGSLQLAEDAVQDVFLSIWQRRESLQVTSQLYIYLLSATTFRIIRYRVNAQKQNQASNGLKVVASSEENPSENFQDIERIERRIMQLIISFPEQTRLIYLLNKEEGNSYKEIATALNISPKTVDYHLSKAVKSLRAAVAGFITMLFLFIHFIFLNH